ncbi:ATP synthase subunit I [Geomonas sp. RF6]|uniref:ATP synthase subunit I n=1 Tax=Geomonas sp. RF6 TaxID=2897342 RepID=UPI001E3970B0|nr:ATP synthase subunit I [Geomonas sp. RF6]UFS72311.1 ATP synthase subunit I [Geomonas sp. RF6]
MKINEDNIFPVLVAGTLIVTAAVSALSAFVASGRFALSVLAGGVLATANFCWLRAGLAAVLGMAEGPAARFAVMRYLLRLAIVGLLLYVLVVPLRADVIGLLLGLSILVLTLITFSLYICTRKGG